MSQSHRLSNEVLVNRNQEITFKFNGKKYIGYEGDTLASALLANGVHLIGRSFKYHRPRGFFGAGVDEPNAKLQIQLNGHSEPNVNATEFELVEGVEATSQNCWPSVEFDVGAINNFLNRFFPAGLCGIRSWSFGNRGSGRCPKAALHGRYPSPARPLFPSARAIQAPGDPRHPAS